MMIRVFVNCFTALFRSAGLRAELFASVQEFSTASCVTSPMPRSRCLAAGEKRP